MDENIEKNSEDLYADTDFNDDYDDLKDAEFVSCGCESVKVEETKQEKTSNFYGKNKKLLAQRIIEKKTGEITEIKYNIVGLKENVTIRDKNKKIKKSTDYFENGSLKYVNEYAPDGSYKSMAYHPDGSRQSCVIKHKDGSADAVYFDVDKTGSRLILKLDKDKNVIEKHVEK